MRWGVVGKYLLGSSLLFLGALQKPLHAADPDSTALTTTAPPLGIKPDLWAQRDFITFFNSIVSSALLRDGADIDAYPQDGTLKDLVLKEHHATGAGPTEIYNAVKEQVDILRGQLEKLKALLRAIESNKMGCTSRAVEVGVRVGVGFGLEFCIGAGIYREAKWSYPFGYLRISNVSGNLDYRRGTLGAVAEVGYRKEGYANLNDYELVNLYSEDDTKNGGASLVLGGYSVEEDARAPVSGFSVGLIISNSYVRSTLVKVPLKVLPFPSVRVWSQLARLKKLQGAIARSLQRLDFHLAQSLIEEHGVLVNNVAERITRRTENQTMSFAGVPLEKNHPLGTVGNLFHPKTLLAFSPALVADAIESSVCEKNADHGVRILK